MIFHHITKGFLSKIGVIQRKESLWIPDLVGQSRARSNGNLTIYTGRHAFISVYETYNPRSCFAVPAYANANARLPTRVSPYPQRQRTPTRTITMPSVEGVARAHPPGAVSTSRSDATPAAHPGLRNQYSITVDPIVKKFVSQQERSGEPLPSFTASGSSFQEIQRVIWDEFHKHIVSRAVRANGEWEVAEKDVTEWHRFMQFKYTTHISTEDQDWSRWLVSHRGKKGVKLLIYTYGVAVATSKDRGAFEAKHMMPARSDRAGAAADGIIQDLAVQIQSQWDAAFRAHEAVWRMWANHIARNPNNSAWPRAIRDPPPQYIAELLRLPENADERQRRQTQASVSTALACVNASIEDMEGLREDWVNFGRRLDMYEHSLQARKRTITALSSDRALPAVTDVIDPLTRIENVEDLEHQE